MNRRSNPSNEHCLFAETLRNWHDPLLQGREKRKPILLCSRCASCKCQSLKDFHRSCPNCHSHRNSFSQRISIKRNQSKIPVRIFFDLSTITTMKKKQQNNESLYQSDLRRKRTRIPRLIVPTSFIKPSVTITSKDSISSIMDEQRPMKKVLKKRSRSSSNKRLHQQRISHSPGRSPSTSSSSISFVPSRKKTRLKSSSSISADEYHPNTFGLTKSTIQTWKNPLSSTEEDDNSYPKYSIEQLLPLTNTTTIRVKPKKEIVLQRVQIDSWQNVDLSNRSILNSTCEESIGSAAHLLSPPIDGHVISISSATQPTQSSLLNQTKKTLWKVNQHGKNRRYSKIKTKSSCFSPVESDSSTDQCLLSNSEKKKKKSMSIDDPMAIPSASTDEDVDELPSHYSEILVDRSSHSTETPSNTMTITMTTVPAVVPSANETSQMTIDSGVDLLSEHRQYPNFILPESNDLFGLSDDSMIDMTSETITMRYEPRSITSTYELEVITDEEDDHVEKNSNCELLITSEMTPVSTVRPPVPPPALSTLPPQFEFKLPTFGEWIDRVFTNFLTETTTTPTSMASSRSSSIVSLPSSHDTGKTVIENPTCSKKDSAPSSDDEDDMSSSSMNCEKIVYDSYMINSNYEKINSSFEEHDDEEKAGAVIDQCSQSSSAIEYVDQVNKIDDQMEPVQSSILNEKILRQSMEDLMKKQTYLSSKDSALDLDEENHLPLEIVEQVLITEDVSSPPSSSSSSSSSSSAEQFIPKEKQTGMYYPAFGSDAPLHLNEDYPSEWFNSKNLRIVHPSQMIGDNEDEFFFSPRILVPSYSCSDLSRFTTTHDIEMHKRRSSLTALDIYQGQILTSEVFEQIWHSFLNLSPSEGEESDLNDYRLRHILGLGNSSLGEKSRSHNDIFTSPSPSSLPICKKSKSFDITSLLKRGNTNRHESVQIGLLQGADISEPFGDHLISNTSIHSDLESLPSFEIEPSSVTTTTKPSTPNTNDEDHLISDEPSTVTSVEHELKKNEQEEVFVLPPKRDTFTELCLFRPHSLSTIPSSRASQYASSVESDEISEHEQRSIRKEQLSETIDDPMSLQISEDDPGLIGSEFSSTQSRSFTPEQFQQSKSLTLTSLTTMESLEEPSTEQIQLYQSLMSLTQQKIDKVTDLEIVQQGKGFKIGYVDRQGTDQRIILTKPLDKTDDIFDRHPQAGLTYKGRKLLNQDFSSVYFTNGYEKIEEDRKFQHADVDIEVPSIGTDPKHFDESDMISIDIDGPSTMLNAICESIVITQGSVYSNRSDRYLSKENSPTLTPTQIKRDRIEVTDHWHDQTVIHGSGTPWRSPLRTKTKQEVSTRDIALSPIIFHPTVDRSCQSSPIDDKSPWHSSTQVSSTDLPGLLKTSETNVSFTEDFPSRSINEHLEQSADSGILVDTRHRHLALQVDLKSSSSDSEDLSESTPRATIERHSADLTRSLSSSCSELEQELFQLRRERTHIIDLLAMNWNRSNIWVELTEAKLNYIIGETDALLRNLSFDATSNSSEIVKNKMHQYEEDMTELTRQRLAIYRERLEDSKKQLDFKINELETKRLGKNVTSSNELIRSYPKRIQSYLSTSAENLHRTSIDETLNNHPHLLDVSFLNSTENLPRERTTSDDHQRVIYRPTPRYPSIKSNLNKLEGLTDSQQAILDETNQLVQDSQQFHSESASQFERARESLLSSATSIELIRSNLAASRLTAHLSRELTLKELFKYEQLLTEETRRQHRTIFSTRKTRTES